MNSFCFQCLTMGPYAGPNPSEIVLLKDVIDDVGLDPGQRHTWHYDRVLSTFAKAESIIVNERIETYQLFENGTLECSIVEIGSSTVRFNVKVLYSLLFENLFHVLSS